MKKFIIMLFLYLQLYTSLYSRPSLAASQLEEISPPVNLSRSGAASQPQILVSSSGALQVFWWDQYDGLMSSISLDAKSWADPIIESIPISDLNKMPVLISDGKDRVHAFWLETKSLSNGSESKELTLLHSQKVFFQSTWSLPELVVESVSAFEVISPFPGTLYLAYLQAQNADKSPVGIYFMKNLLDSTTWTAAVPIYKSNYLRSVTAEQLNLTLLFANSNISDQVGFITWDDPHLGKTQIAFSPDDGISWSTPQSLENNSIDLSSPYIIPAPKASLVWQSVSQNGCSLFQQDISIENTEQSQVVLQLGTLKKIADAIVTCPQVENFFNVDDQWLWAWGSDSSAITLSAFDSIIGQWSQPYRLSVPIQDLETEKVSYLSDLVLAIDVDQMVIAGVDETSGDVWLVQIWVPGLLLTYANPSPWSDLQPLEINGMVEEPPTMVIDGVNRTFAVWSQSPTVDSTDNSLALAHNDLEGNFETVEFRPANINQVARQPSLFYEAERGILHLVWSGGENGGLLYQYVSESQAGDPSAWSVPKTISSLYNSSRPQLTIDRSGNIYVLFVVPLNQARGVYLVTSFDQGASWSQPRIVFDAAQAGYDMVDQPTLAVGSDDSLHAAWVHTKAPGLGGSIAIEYAQSIDHSQTWTTPLILSGERFSQPCLAFTGEVLHLLFAPDPGSSGGIYHRYATSRQNATQSNAWSVPMAIPGWQQVNPHYGIAAGSKLYLVSASSTSGQLYFSIWNGESWTAEDGFEDTIQISHGLGVSTAVQEKEGQMSIIWLAYPTGKDVVEPSLFMLKRQIPAVETSELEVKTQVETTTPVVIPTKTGEPVPTIIPSLTPNLNRPVQSSSLPLPPMILGGILAAALVGVAFVGFLWHRWAK